LAARTPEIRENVALAPLTTIGVGGLARFFAEVASVDELRGALAWADAHQTTAWVLGGGSNVVFADNGYPGLVIRMALRGVKARKGGRLKAGAGEDWDALVTRAAADGLAGIECLAGIPGQVGATPIQNVGAYGQEVAETIESVDTLDRRTGELAAFPADECGFAYRDSRFKGRDRGRYVVTGVTFALRSGGEPALRYADLIRYFEERGSQPVSLDDMRRAVIEVRRRKAMVVDPAEPNSVSCGSFFTNPIVTPEELEEIRQNAEAAGLLTAGDRLPAHQAEDGRMKLSAAWLIERAGFTRGLVRGGVGLSERHVLAIVNRGGGTAREVVALAAEIRAKVRDVFGVQLAPEPAFPGIVTATK
jgi:UDP-N-acetylmuramate dehydrogenase